MRVDVGGVGISFEVAGLDNGSPVILLHGFPDSGRLWRNQVPALTGAGFRVIVPDLRGAGRSDKPADVDAYRIPLLVGDVLAVLDSLGIGRANVVGHDWGAALAWGLAMGVPDRVERLVVLSVGHPAAFSSAGIAQKEKSWYTFLFQYKGVAEAWLSGNNWAGFRELLDHPDTDGVIADIERDGSLTSALNWYRANFSPEQLTAPPQELPTVRTPTMGVWSSGDRFLLEQQIAGSAPFMAGPWRYERIEHASHWMQIDAADTVSGLLVDFLSP